MRNFSTRLHGWLLTNYRGERERERKFGGVVRDTTIVGVKETIFSVLKVPRQCLLVLLKGVSLEFRINSKF
jgi:hypothetical protein